jgi:hypothetical protein
VELHQNAVTGSLYDTAAILGNGRIDELDPMGLETRERTCLVDLHQRRNNSTSDGCPVSPFLVGPRFDGVGAALLRIIASPSVIVFISNKLKTGRNYHARNREN